MRGKYYRWQPELAFSIIYWSIALIVLFSSLILSLENTRPYWKSNLVLVFFFVLLGIGFRRSFVIKNHYLHIRYAFYWKDQKVMYSEIKKIVVGSRGIQLFTHTKKEPAFYIMRKKPKRKMIETLKSQNAPCKITFDDTIKMSKE